METVNLPDFYFDFKNADDDIKKLIRKIKPKWEEDKLDIKKISGGLSCETYRVSAEPDEGFIVRVRKLFSKENYGFANAEFEEKIVQLLSKRDLFPNIVAIFKNGYCYQYIEGKPLLNVSEGIKASDFDNLPLQQIAEKLAEIHNLAPEDIDPKEQPDLFSKTLAVLEKNFPSHLESELFSKDVLKKELMELEALSKEMNITVGLCHGDCHLGNVIWNDELKKITFVDWEISNIGYQVYDIAYFFQHFGYTDFIAMPHLPQLNRELVRKQKEDFITFYYKKYLEIKKGGSEWDDNEFAELKRQVNFFILCFCVVRTTLFCAVNKNPDVNPNKFLQDVKPKEILKLNFENYLKIKDKKLRELKLI